MNLLKYSTIAGLLLGLALTSCDTPEKPVYFNGVDLTAMEELHIYSNKAGIYPSLDVLKDPENPFAMTPPTRDGKWVIEAGTGVSPVAKYYSWATALATDGALPGESQYFTGLALKTIYLEKAAADEDLQTVRAMAIAAFQSVLDDFPNDLHYDWGGGNPIRLVTWAYFDIIALGGTPKGNWVVVVTPGDPQGQTVIQTFPNTTTEEE